MDKLTIDYAMLKYYMELKKYNKSSLADAAGISKNTVSAIFSNRDVSMSSAQKVINALDIPSEIAGSIFFKPNLRNT